MTAKDELQKLLANAAYEATPVEQLYSFEEMAAKMLQHLLDTQTSWLIRNGKVHKVEEIRDGWPDDGRYFWELTTEQDEDNELYVLTSDNTAPTRGVDKIYKIVPAD